MNKTALLLALGSALVFGPSVASAYDDDPGYGTYRPWYGGNGDRSYRPQGEIERDRRNEPIYYRPTMRYYGKGYTVSYRYMPVYAYENGYGNQNISSNFRTEDFRISTQDIPAWGAKPPRLVVPNKKTPSQTAVTSIVRSKPTPVYSTPTNLPTPGAPLPVPTAPLPTPTLDPTAPVPGVSDAPKP
jgi:hypothetical protein